MSACSSIVLINTVIHFVIVAFAIFLLIRNINRFKKQEEAAPTSKDCSFCFTKIPIQATHCPNCTSEWKRAA